MCVLKIIFSPSSLMCVEKKSKKLVGNRVGRKAYGDNSNCFWIMIKKTKNKHI